VGGLLAKEGIALGAQRLVGDTGQGRSNFKRPSWPNRHLSDAGL